ncbi:hypothetical protein [Roseovarius arcticus]|uniref:hypothetical protein n=1 Tax=Roseovarius arcticus TaxID=2547404 RepID=UPI001110E64B|nr:hypothetical protein [Roseovarius arcticus]
MAHPSKSGTVHGTSGGPMANNDNTNPATQGDQAITGATGADTLTGGLGNDTIIGRAGDDYLRGDGAVPGAWHFETFDYDFSSSAGQAFDITLRAARAPGRDMSPTLTKVGLQTPFAAPLVILRTSASYTLAR